MIVRILHTGLCCFIAATLLWKETALHEALIELKNPVYGVVFLCTVLLSLCLYFIASCMDPGYVSILQHKQDVSRTLVMESDHGETSEDETTGEQNNQPPVESDNDKRNRYKYRFCDYCEIKPPLRSKHCKECKACVHRYDHHCPWLESCVGERNHKIFWWFLLVTSTLVVWTFVIVWQSFINEKTWTDWFHRNLVLFLDSAVLVFCGPVVIGLLCFHTYLMVNGFTTWETASRERITYLKYLQPEYNPFDEGCATNVYSFMFVYNTRRWEKVYSKRAKFKDSPV